MHIELPTLAAIVIPSVGAIVWLVRLEGRVNLSEARHTDVIDRLTRIERKIDRNGHDR